MLNMAGGTGYRFGSGSGVISYAAPSLGVTGSFSGRRAGLIRPGQGIDSHAAVTRFLGLSSGVLMDARLPDTGFWQMGGAARANWRIDPQTNLIASYTRTAQDDGKRYDQLLGGDGNLVSDLNDLSLDLLSVRLERLGLGPFDHASFSYSLNSQREERVNQGGNGNPAATIGRRDDAAVAPSDADVWGRPVSGRTHVRFLQRQSDDRSGVAPPAAGTRRCQVLPGRSLRSDHVRGGSRSSASGRSAQIWRRELRGQRFRQSDGWRCAALA
jgi:hypothetical protein